MKLHVVCGIFFSALFLSAAPSGAAETYGTQSNQGAPPEAGIIFYGKVVDQYGRPVYKARVSGGREYLDSNRIRFFGAETVRAETDAEGKFTFTGTLMKKIYVREIEKRCYETLRKGAYIGAYSLDSSSTEPLYRPDPAKPVVFVMQKKFDPGMVDLKKGRMMLYTGMEGFTVDIRKGFSDAIESLTPRHAERDIVARITPERDYYKLVISAPGKNNGLADVSGAPHIAPDSGYQPGFEFRVPKGGSSKIQLYHKGRGGKVYSRLELVLTRTSSGISIAGELYTNFVGGKNTDFDSFYTEEQIVRRTGRKLSFGGSAYRQEVAAMMDTTLGSSKK